MRYLLMVLVQPPMVSSKLQESPFGLGLLYDTLHIESTEHFRTSTLEISPTLLFTLIENVLGYKMIYTNGSLWTYRREIAFK